MLEGNNELVKIVQYMKAHWPSEVKPEWQVSLEEYPALAQKIIADYTQGKTKNKKMVRIAGVSGSGKTTQLLPAAEEYFAVRNMKPVLVAARRFVEYHPHCQKIKDYYGEENLRKMTDEFGTIMMFLCMQVMVAQGYDIILDVTLLDPAIESILLKALGESKYDSMILMIAAASEVVEKHLSGRSWRHSKETEQEFIRATEQAMKFYAKTMPNMRVIMWNVYDEVPVYDGAIGGALEIFSKYSSEADIPEHNEEVLKAAKKQYMASQR